MRAWHTHPVAGAAGSLHPPPTLSSPASPCHCSELGSSLSTPALSYSSTVGPRGKQKPPSLTGGGVFLSVKRIPYSKPTVQDSLFWALPDAVPLPLAVQTPELRAQPLQGPGMDSVVGPSLLQLRPGSLVGVSQSYSCHQPRRCCCNGPVSFRPRRHLPVVPLCRQVQGHFPINTGPLPDPAAVAPPPCICTQDDARVHVGVRSVQQLLCWDIGGQERNVYARDGALQMSSQRTAKCCLK